MVLHRESRGVPRALPVPGEGAHPRARTSPTLGSPSHRGARATASRARPLVALALALAACDPYVQGNGVFLEENRAVPAFDAIRVTDGIAATITAGAATPSVAVIGDANVVQYVTTAVVDAELRGRPSRLLQVSVSEDDFDTTIPLHVRVSAGALRAVLAPGAGKIVVENAAADDFVVEASGVDAMSLTGAGGTALHATLDDTWLDAHRYPVVTADVTLTNRSTVQLDADGAVTGTAHGTSTVDNLLGAATCATVVVSKDETSQVLCTAAAP